VGVQATHHTTEWIFGGKKSKLKIGGNVPNIKMGSSRCFKVTVFYSKHPAANSKIVLNGFKKKRNIEKEIMLYT
jgi:hypothetical protein